MDPEADRCDALRSGGVGHRARCRDVVVWFLCVVAVWCPVRRVYFVVSCVACEISDVMRYCGLKSERVMFWGASAFWDLLLLRFELGLALKGTLER